MKNFFSEDGKQYSSKDPDKIVLLQGLGAKIVKRDTTDPRNIVFTLEHDRIAEFVDAIHSGNLGQYGNILRADKCLELRKQLMSYINEVKLNAREK